MQLITPADGAGRVTDALKSAAQTTGAGFDYLVRTAKRESSLNPAAQNPASSARGLFQFIDSTWLEVLKEEGAKLGMGDAAASIQKTSSGRYAVPDAAKRAELLAMRDDPHASALLAGAFTQRNAARLASALGRAPTEGELYAAHFLGAKGASQLAALASSSPDANAAAAFPAQASANRAIFFENGRGRTVGEVYAKLTAGASATASVPSLAKNALTVTTASVRPQATEPVEPQFNGGVENDQAAFHSMFKTGRRSPVSAYVSQAWSSFGDAGLTADLTKTAATRDATRTIAPAYAPQAASIDQSLPKPAVAALAAVNEAAAAPRRPARAKAASQALPGAVPLPAPAAPAAVASSQAASGPAATQVAPPASERPGGLVAFLKSVLAPLSADRSRAAIERVGARP